MSRQWVKERLRQDSFLHKNSEGIAIIGRISVPFQSDDTARDIEASLNRNLERALNRFPQPHVACVLVERAQPGAFSFEVVDLVTQVLKPFLDDCVAAHRGLPP